MKASAISPANIAFIKYWGWKDPRFFLPVSTTNSMNLSNCTAHTTVEFNPNFKKDEFIIIHSNNKEELIDPKNGIKNKLLFQTLKDLKKLAGIKYNSKVLSKLSFPMEAGIASSAAGMSAFVASISKALNLSNIVDDKKTLSQYVRMTGSVSAARSVEDGFTEHILGKSHEDTYTKQIADVDHWNLIDIVTVLNPEKKKYSSSIGHEIAYTSPFMNARIEYLKGKPEQTKNAILDRDFDSLATLSEIDSINMHAVMMTSKPALYYLSEGSMSIIKQVLKMREEGIKIFFTFDAGANAHLIAIEKDLNLIKKHLEKNTFIQYLIENKPAKGVRIVNEHIF